MDVIKNGKVFFFFILFLKRGYLNANYDRNQNFPFKMHINIFTQLILHACYTNS